MLLVTSRGSDGSYSLGHAERRKDGSELWASPAGELSAPCCALRVVSEPKAGRSLVAAMDVPAGQVLFIETPMLQNEVHPSEADKKLMTELADQTRGEFANLIDEFGHPMTLAGSHCGLWRLVGLLHAYGKADAALRKAIDNLVHQLPEHPYPPAHSPAGSKSRLLKGWLSSLQKSGLFDASLFRDKAYLLRLVMFFTTHPIPFEQQTSYRQYGIFEYSGLVDHSCEPNMVPTPGYMKDNSTFVSVGSIAPVAGVPAVMLWKTLVALQPGDPITFAYTGARVNEAPIDCSRQFVDHVWDPELHRVGFSRRLEIFNTYGFVCGCKKCERECGFDGGTWLQMYLGLLEEYIASRDAVFGNGMADIRWEDWVEWYDEHPQAHPIPDELDMMLQKARDRAISALVCDPLAVAERLRCAGSKYFEVERLDRAIRRYNQAKRFLPTGLASGEAPPDRPAFASKIRGACEMFCRCCANIALCYLKLTKYEECRLACDEFLAVTPGGSKTIASLREKVLYRKAKALLELGKAQAASETLGELAAGDDSQVAALRRDIDERLSVGAILGSLVSGPPGLSPFL